MPQVIRTETFDGWLKALRDLKGRARVDMRIRRLADGNPGDVRPVGKGVSELRIDTGPGYRVYYAAKGEEIIVLLAGGDKSTQARDIETALALWEDWKAENP
ncbi:MAG: type II toxin-antitoxin system RelE/ParE family toxin [Caulobacterales bacterium]